jgi:hypothetical protein
MNWKKVVSPFVLLIFAAARRLCANSKHDASLFDDGGVSIA